MTRGASCFPRPYLCDKISCLKKVLGGYNIYFSASVKSLPSSKLNRRKEDNNTIGSL